MVSTYLERNLMCTIFATLDETSFKRSQSNINLAFLQLKSVKTKIN